MVDDKVLAAKAILDSEIFQEALIELRKVYLSRWENSPTADIETREDLWRDLQSLNRVRRHLESYLVTGEIEELEKKLSFL